MTIDQTEFLGEAAMHALEFLPMRGHADHEWDEQKFRSLIGYLARLDVRDIESLVIGVRHKSDANDVGTVMIGSAGPSDMGATLALALQQTIACVDGVEIDVRAMTNALEQSPEDLDAVVCAGHGKGTPACEHEQQFIVIDGEKLPDFFPSEGDRMNADSPSPLIN